MLLGTETEDAQTGGDHLEWSEPVTVKPPPLVHLMEVPILVLEALVSFQELHKLEGSCEEARRSRAPCPVPEALPARAF